MYYTKVPYSLANDDSMVTTGYIDRKVYETNPLTIKDLQQYLTKRYGSMVTEKVFDDIHQIIYKAISTADLHTSDTIPKDRTMLQLFGTDIAVSNTFEPHIMEINKGPDLSAKDDRDRELKENMVEDMLALVGLCKIGRKNGFLTS
jgi:hypothetical protein